MKHFFTTFFLLLSCVSFSQEFENLPSDSLSAKSDTIQPNFIDRVMNLFEVNRGRYSVKYYPTFGYDPASGANLGILSLFSIEPKGTRKRSFYRPTSVTFSGSYSTKHWLDLKSDCMVFTRNGIVVNSVVSVQTAPDKFYGIGNDTLYTNPLKFKRNDFQLSGNVSKGITSCFFIGFSYDFMYCLHQGRPTESQTLTLPSEGCSSVFGIGPFLTYDTRDNVNYPTNGEYVTINANYYLPITKKQSTFLTATINARKYCTLFKSWILAMQFVAGTCQGNAPFYKLNQLGGLSRMRGISNKYKYIDKNSFYAQCEVRKHIWRRFSATAFGGIGNAFNEFIELKTRTLKYVYGGGIRFQSDTKNSINVRIDYGRGIFGDSGVYVTMREAF